MIEIINGDCEIELPKINAKSIDLIATDPPYCINYADWDKIDNIDFIRDEYYRILKDSGQILIFTGWTYSIELISSFSKKFKLKDWIIWDRIKGRGSNKSLTSTREDLLWFIKSDIYTFNKEFAYSTIEKKTKGTIGNKNGKKFRSLSNIWTDISPIVPWSSERNIHPTQKPLKLMERIVKIFSNENDLVLDSFAGSGTTAEACKKLNRNCICIEKNEEYSKIIKNRIEKYLF